ncbi:MAG: hypothetical protein WBV46_01820 [Terriglobales bacterium]|jgi:hypothetical protein
MMRSIRLFAFLAGFCFVLAAQPSVACSNATLKGSFGFVLTGVNSSEVLTATVGQMTADGSGGLTGSETVSNDGVITSNVSMTGSYSLAKNCTGTATITPAAGSASNYSLVVIGTQIQMVETDTGYTEAGYAVEQGSASCSIAGIKGTFGFRGGGWNVSSSLIPTADAGQVKADGSGNLSGTQQGSFGGQVYSTSISGSYTVNENCTGTVTYSVEGTTTHANFVAVDGEKLAFLIQTDPGAIVTTVTQK